MLHAYIVMTLAALFHAARPLFARGVTLLSGHKSCGRVAMGSFLDTPKTEKETERYANERLKCAVSSMQGWRIEMEVSPRFAPAFVPVPQRTLV